MELKEEKAYLEAIEACRQYALLQSEALEAWLDTGMNTDELIKVINGSYSIEYAITRLSEMTGIDESLVKEIVSLPGSEITDDNLQSRLDYYSQAAEVLGML